MPSEIQRNDTTEIKKKKKNQRKMPTEGLVIGIINSLILNTFTA